MIHMHIVRLCAIVCTGRACACIDNVYLAERTALIDSKSSSIFSQNEKLYRHKISDPRTLTHTNPHANPPVPYAVYVEFLRTVGDTTGLLSFVRNYLHRPVSQS